MPIANRTFRLFVSSTFSDMRAERRMLQEMVFPRLKSLCESKGTGFQAFDLRWGVNEEAQLDHKTMDICLSERDITMPEAFAKAQLHHLYGRQVWLAIETFIDNSWPRMIP